MKKSSAIKSILQLTGEEVNWYFAKMEASNYHQLTLKIMAYKLSSAPRNSEAEVICNNVIAK